MMATVVYGWNARFQNVGNAGKNEAREEQNDKFDTRFEAEAETGERFEV
jgi:hypothetical protein